MVGYLTYILPNAFHIIFVSHFSIPEISVQNLPDEHYVLKRCSVKTSNAYENYQHTNSKLKMFITRSIVRQALQVDYRTNISISTK